MADDDWMAAALSDGSLVADLLVKLRRTSPPKLSPPATLKWRVRQRRSRPMVQSSSKPPPAPTTSPTTPLSWNGATSAAADGFEESSSPLPATVRSKGLDARENTGSKRSRKKKTLAELKEDEVLFLKERKDLKKKLASLRATIEIEKATNDRLKRLKLEYISISSKGVASPVPTDESSKLVPSYNTFSTDLRINEIKSVEQRGLDNQENKLVLPDLNLPVEDLAA